jgi:putative intracellular protease/amidase
MTNVNLLVFDDFETLDLFGPVEIFGQIDSFKLNYYSLQGGIVLSHQKVSIITNSINEADQKGILLIPGGQGTRTLINNAEFISHLNTLAKESIYCLTVCTGSALLAKTNILKGHRATSNKLAFDWVKSVDPEAEWIEEARWVVDGKFYTSSGISAGIDMALGFVTDLFGQATAQKIADHIEYVWNSDKTKDLFCRKQQ